MVARRAIAAKVGFVIFDQGIVCERCAGATAGLTECLPIAGDRTLCPDIFFDNGSQHRGLRRAGQGPKVRSVVD